jgi:hypothetical protein
MLEVMNVHSGSFPDYTLKCGFPQDDVSNRIGNVAVLHQSCQDEQALDSGAGIRGLVAGGTVTVAHRVVSPERREPREGGSLYNVSYTGTPNGSPG